MNNENLELNVLKWDMRWLEMAKLVSTWSKDPSTKVGAVIADHKQQISIGYNGFPQKIQDDERLHIREVKYKIIRHAEDNAIKHKSRPDLQGCTIYTFPFMPCSRCAGRIIDEDITRVVSFKSSHSRWEKEFEFSRQLFYEASVELIEYEYES